jgi:hypothetical protein
VAGSPRLGARVGVARGRSCRGPRAARRGPRAAQWRRGHWGSGSPGPEVRVVGGLHVSRSVGGPRVGGRRWRGGAVTDKREKREREKGKGEKRKDGC